jgi:hypothetical protein
MLYMEVVWNQGYATLLSLYFNVLFTLLALVLLNALLRRFWPSGALRPGELLVVFVMLNIGTSLAIFLEYLVPAMVYPYRFATPENQWQRLIWPYLPSWLTVSDPTAVKLYYEGHAVLETWDHVRPWLKPLLLWSGFTLTVVGVMVCLNALLRRQWTERERLGYPIVRIPLEITAERDSPFRTGLFWAGFALAAGIDLLNGLSFLYPVIPSLSVKRQAFYPFLGAPRPWSAVNLVTYAFHPFAIGLGYFLPQDLLFSSWFFYWFAKAQSVGAAAIGWDDWDGDAYFRIAPYLNEQSCGALLGLILFALWAARRQLRGGEGRGEKRREEGAKHGQLGNWATGQLGNQPQPPEPNFLISQFPSVTSGPSGDEPLPYCVALLGAAVGFLLLVAFVVTAGMSLWAALLYFGLFFALSLAVTRMRAQFGPPASGLFLTAPNRVLYNGLGVDALGPRSLTVLTYLHWLHRMYSGSPMPHQLEAFKLAERQNLRYRGMIGAILLSAAVAVLFSFWTVLHLSYDLGQDTAATARTQNYFGREPLVTLQGLLQRTHGEPDPGALAAVGGGCLLTLFLMVMRTRFLGWPFHPVGYALTSAYATHILWLSMLLAWIIKSLIVRYGGLRLYRRGMPFFLGLLLGEFVVGSGWGLVGVMCRMRTYVFWPY